MTATYDIATSAGKIRFRLGDTRTETAFFSDAELASLLADYGSVDAATAAAARVCLMHLGRFARSFSSVAGTVDETAAASILQDLIDRYGGAELSIPVATVRRTGGYPSDPNFRRRTT